MAILLQLFMISKTGEAKTITTHYLFFLGLYQGLYFINCAWHFYFEGFFDLIAVVVALSRPSSTGTSSTCTSHKYSRKRSSVCQGKCQRPSPAPVLRGAWTEFLPEQRHKMLQVENQKLNSCCR
ncbi:ER lumen protein retaining receptor 2 [Myotis brandtii]|uniref:ER lumen protein retaining receptor 2 n=1 Tax=Myotis brandtii TaxID=109478 RepID=S7PCL0_MYOBR|nr:ER lumen protein retaining receptor 2 [Myotis brandtii]